MGNFFDVFIRAFGIVLAIAALWWSTNSFGFGLGLGDIKIESTLASPLRASIPLRGLAENVLDPEQFSVSIDSGTNAAIEYRLQRIDADSASLLLYTRMPISEPLLQFRVEVKWDRSAVVRSYDVFIDPPAYGSNPPSKLAAADTSGEPVQAVDKAVAEVGVEPVPEPIALDGDADAALLEVDPGLRKWLRLAEPAAVTDARLQRREYGPTIDGNSIWRVARAVASDNRELNIYQWMYAIWKANPDAFFQSNMHRLNMGELLSVPLEREVAAVSRSEAYRVYSEQLALLQSESRETQGAIANTARTRDAAMTESPLAGSPVHEAPVNEVERRSGDSEMADFAAAESPVAGLAESPDTLTEEESRGVAMALIDEVEQGETFPVNPSTGDEAVVAPQGQVVLDLVESADSDLQEADVVGAPREPMQEVQAQTGSLAQAPASVQPAAERAIAIVAAESSNGWNNTLDSRRNLIASLPLIGAQQPLAVVGRAIQQVDEFIATSPSWAALAFGGWLMLVLLMLSNAFRRLRLRRQYAAEPVQTPGEQLVRTSPTPVMPPAAVKADPAPMQPSAYRAPIKLPPRHAPGKIAQKSNINFNADEILAKADGFMKARNTEEAIKLLELAIKLQPERLQFVLRLLEIYHKLKRADEFESLLLRFKPALSALDTRRQIDVQAMYARLRPRAEPLIDPRQPGEVDEPAAADAAAQDDGELVAGCERDEPDSAVDEEEYAATQVVFMNSGVPLDGDPEPMTGLVGEVIDLEVTLKEVDVYLAYGLYDNAEELLLKGMEVDPNRVDYLAKLLDTYYATKNLVDFLTCAEALREMGEEANNEYWDKVEVMGYELAPYNELFAGGKDRSLSGIDLAIAKPESADFDVGDETVGGGGSIADIDLSDDGDEGLVDDLNLEFAAQTESSADDLVAEILAENLDEDPTNLNFDDDITTNENFDNDGAVILDQVDNDPWKGDDDDEVPDLDQNFSKADEAEPVNLDPVDASVRGPDEDEVMKFIMAEESEPEQAPADGSDALMADTAVDAAAAVSAAKQGEGRILFFPDSSAAREANAEFESEVKMTLQALRDQLQYMTERLFRQERETDDLKRTLAELSEQEDDSHLKGSKKTS